MIKQFILLLLTASLLVNCKNEIMDADAIVSKSIKVSGGDFINAATINFNFRDKHYRAERNKGAFKLERSFKDSTNIIKDVLTNNGFERLINSEPFDLSDKKKENYSASVNSVHYFSVLPYGLENSAVKKTFIGKTKVNLNSYYKIKITFSEDGGGEDFEDVFLYWINEKTFKVKYLAYSYEENNELGLRFREAFNERFIKGIRFVDYNNYKPNNKNATLDDLEHLFESDKLELLSKIELKNISVVL